MQLAIDFFTTNRLIIHFTYPLVFLLMGFGILLKNKVHSRFILSDSLNYLGIFGVVHGVSDWGSIFIPLQAAYLKSPAIQFLYDLQLVLKSLSFSFLLLFGIHLLQKSLGISRKILFLPPLVFGIWALFAILSKLIFFRYDNNTWLYFASAVSNYLILLPAGLLSGYAIYIQKRQFVEFGVGFLTRYLLLTSVFLYFYTFLTGFVFTKDQDPHLKASIIPLMFRFADLPIEVLRALDGIFIAVLIIRILQVVDIEYQQFFYNAERSRVVTDERNRIARDLHDGMIQSIYAFGLHLESIHNKLERRDTQSIDESILRTKQIMGKVNELIAEIRGYIAELKMSVEISSSLQGQIAKLIDSLRPTLSMRISLRYLYQGEEPSLPVVVQSFYIIKEALSNVVKHSQATEAVVSVVQEGQELLIEIRDNGIGFNPEQVKESGGFMQGIRNMEYRAKVVDGSLSIQSGEGTTVWLRIPVTRLGGV